MGFCQSPLVSSCSPLSCEDEEVLRVYVESSVQQLVYRDHVAAVPFVVQRRPAFHLGCLLLLGFEAFICGMLAYSSGMECNTGVVCPSVIETDTSQLVSLGKSQQLSP